MRNSATHFLANNFGSMHGPSQIAKCDRVEWPTFVLAPSKRSRKQPASARLEGEAGTKAQPSARSSPVSPFTLDVNDRAANPSAWPGISIADLFVDLPGRLCATPISHQTTSLRHELRVSRPQPWRIRGRSIRIACPTSAINLRSRPDSSLPSPGLSPSMKPFLTPRSPPSSLSTPVNR